MFLEMKNDLTKEICLDICTTPETTICIGGELIAMCAVCWGSGGSVRQRVSSRGSVGVGLGLLIGRGRSSIGGLLVGRGSLVGRGRGTIHGGGLLVGNSRGAIGVNSRRSIGLSRSFIFRSKEKVGEDGSLQEGDLAQEQAINQGAASKGRKGDGPNREEEGLRVCLGGRGCL